jgi:hypothetical protein
MSLDAALVAQHAILDILLTTHILRHALAFLISSTPFSPFSPFSPVSHLEIVVLVVPSIVFTHTLNVSDVPKSIRDDRDGHTTENEQNIC